jgi:hypothetical protein
MLLNFAVLCSAALQDRSLESCLAQIFQQQPSQHLQHKAPPLQHLRSQHCGGWQVTGAVLTAPVPALSTKQHQLLYVNSRPAACPVLAQLLRDWFIKHVKTLAGEGAAAGMGQIPVGTAAPAEAAAFAVGRLACVHVEQQTCACTCRPFHSTPLSLLQQPSSCAPLSLLQQLSSCADWLTAALFACRPAAWQQQSP